MKPKLKLHEITPEGEIVRALSSGGISFSGLVKATHLSPRWLSVKLKTLLKLGVVKAENSTYRLDHQKLRTLQAPSLGEVARAAAFEIVELHHEVLSVVLFGSVAKGRVEAESDIDLLVISGEPLNLTDEEFRISKEYGLAFELTSMTLGEFLAVLHLKSSLLFGILEGYEVIFDRAGIAALLDVSMREVLKGWRHVGEGLWLKQGK